MNAALGIVQGLRSSGPWRDACAYPVMKKLDATRARKGFRRTWLDAFYECKTPLFDRYYKEVRKRLNFPRAPKRALGC